MRGALAGPPAADPVQAPLATGSRAGRSRPTG